MPHGPVVRQFSSRRFPRNGDRAGGVFQFSPAIAAFENGIEPAAERCRQNGVWITLRTERQQRIFHALQVGKLPCQRKRIDIRSRLSDCTDHPLQRIAVGSTGISGQNPRKIAIGVASAGIARDLRAVPADHFQRNQQDGAVIGENPGDETVGIDRPVPTADPFERLRCAMNRRSITPQSLDLAEIREEARY